MPSAAVPLVLLHGFGGHADVWPPIINRLGPAQPVLAYDLPGHGRSLTADGAGHAGDLAKALLADLQARGVWRFHVVGHSLGGATAALMAIRAADRVASLTMLSPGGFGHAINHRALKRFALARTGEELRLALEPMLGFNGCLSDDVVMSMAKARSTPDATVALTVILSTFLQERDGRLGQGTLPLEQLASLPMPIRLVWGVEDMIVPISQADGLPIKMMISRIEGVGHMLIEEAPLAVLAAINANLLRA